MNHPTAQGIAASIFDAIEVVCPEFDIWAKQDLGDGYQRPLPIEKVVSRVIHDSFAELTLHVHLIGNGDDVKLWLIYGEHRKRITDVTDRKNADTRGRMISALLGIPYYVNGKRQRKGDEGKAPVAEKKVVVVEKAPVVAVEKTPEPTPYKLEQLSFGEVRPKRRKDRRRRK